MSSPKVHVLVFVDHTSYVCKNLSFVCFFKIFKKVPTKCNPVVTHRIFMSYLLLFWWYFRLNNKPYPKPKRQTKDSLTKSHQLWIGITFIETRFNPMSSWQKEKRVWCIEAHVTKHWFGKKTKPYLVTNDCRVRSEKRSLCFMHRLNHHHESRVDNFLKMWNLSDELRL